MLGKTVPTRLLDVVSFAFAWFSSFNFLSLINKLTSLTVLLNIYIKILMISYHRRYMTNSYLPTICFWAIRLITICYHPTINNPITHAYIYIIGHSATTLANYSFLVDYIYNPKIISRMGIHLYIYMAEYAKLNSTSPMFLSDGRICISISIHQLYYYL